MAKLRRNAQAVLKCLAENEAGQIIAKVPCKIQAPVRFSEVGLGTVGVNVFIYGLFPIIIETGEYAVMNITALVELDPSEITVVTIDEDEYHEFKFEAGQVVIKSSDVIRRKTLMFNIFDELIFKGKVPWYVGYEDLGKVFDTALEYGDAKVGEVNEPIELITSMVTRAKADRRKYARVLAKSYDDVTLDKISFVALKSVFYSINSTLNKLTGSYFSDGVTSALVNPTSEVGKIEAILRA